MRSAIVSAKVGIDCIGSLMVRTCCIPSSPYHLRSLIRPGTGRNFSTNRLRYSCTDLTFGISGALQFWTNAVGNKAGNIQMWTIPGSWNMMTTLSADTWTSRWLLCHVTWINADWNYRFRCLPHHRVWRLRSWRECFREISLKPTDAT